jgi:hypothetical protein
MALGGNSLFQRKQTFEKQQLTPPEGPSQMDAPVDLYRPIHAPVALYRPVVPVLAEAGGRGVENVEADDVETGEDYQMHDGGECIGDPAVITLETLF